MNKQTICTFGMIAIVVLAACNPTAPSITPQITIKPAKTTSIPTIELIQTDTPEATSTSLFTETPETSSPVETLQPAITATPRRCNEISLIEDVGIPNGTVLTINQGFVKIWHVKNTGSCPWTSDYKFVFGNGERMSDQDKQLLTNGIIRPGEEADISVSLVAPVIAGTYRGTWKIRDPKGIPFEPGNGSLDVEITTVLTPQPTAENTNLPDLYVSEFALLPEKPIKGQPVHVAVGVYNQGNAGAAKFTVSWYGLSTFTGPSCSWDILDSLPPGEGRSLECDFIFQSTYPADKTSLVMIDPGNHILESNEGNNQGIISPIGVFSH